MQKMIIEQIKRQCYNKYNYIIDSETPIVLFK